MARNEELERRCLNWARWKEGASSGGLGYASVYLPASVAGRDSFREATVPTLDVEAEQTDRAVMALPSALRRTVEVYYLGSGSMEDRCRLLQISRPTIYVRIDKAHEALAAWLREAEAKVRHDRERLELLQASARPKGPVPAPAKTLRRRARGSSKD